jgi:hypothetical protein
MRVPLKSIAELRALFSHPLSSKVGKGLITVHAEPETYETGVEALDGVSASS